MPRTIHQKLIAVTFQPVYIFAQQGKIPSIGRTYERTCGAKDPVHLLTSCCFKFRFIGQFGKCIVIHRRDGYQPSRNDRGCDGVSSKNSAPCYRIPCVIARRSERPTWQSHGTEVRFHRKFSIDVSPYCGDCHVTSLLAMTVEV